MGDAQPEKLSRWLRGRLFLAILFDNLFDVRAKQAIRDYHQKIKGNTPGVGVPGVVFCGCNDATYETFALPFLSSAEALGGPLHVHFHLYAPSQKALDHVDEMRRSLSRVQLTFTWEDPVSASSPDGPDHSAATRFLVLHHLLSACRAPILCLDIHRAMPRPSAEIFEAIGRGDVMLRFRPGRRRLGHRVSADVVGVGHTREALGFTKKLAAGVWRGLRMRPRGRIDGPALSYLYAIRSRLRPRLRWQPAPDPLSGGRIGYDVVPVRGASVRGYTRTVEDFYAVGDRASGNGTHG